MRRGKMNVRKILVELAGGTALGVAVILLLSSCIPFDPSRFGLGVTLIALALVFSDKDKMTRETQHEKN